MLERAGWKVLRVPYRSWRENPETQLQRILDELKSDSEAADDAPEAKPAAAFPQTVYVDKFEDAVIKALRAGKRSRDDVFKAARELLGYSRLGPQVRVALADALDRLDLRKIVRIEENEVFFFDDGARGGTYVAKNLAPSPVARPKRRRYRRYRSYRRY